jgi:hypothetical protein
LVYGDRTMGTLYTPPYGFQIRITNKLLPRDLWATFDTRDAAEQYMQQLEALLAQGIVPAALLERGNVKQEIRTVQRCILEYVKNNPVPVSDRKLLDTLMPGVATVPTSALNLCPGLLDHSTVSSACARPSRNSVPALRGGGGSSTGQGAVRASCRGSRLPPIQ